MEQEKADLERQVSKSCSMQVLQKGRHKYGFVAAESWEGDGGAGVWVW